MASTIQKWGNSLAVRVPKAVAEQLDFRQGTEVEFDTSGGALTIRPRRRRRRRHTLASLLSRMKGPSPHRALDRTAPVGRELI